jgi:uncharacterized protein YbjT (DUF2867 family)
MATEEDVMNATQNWTAAEVPSELKEQLFTAVSRVISDPEWMDSMIPDVDVVEAILAALANAGYTIAGPGQVVVDRGRVERLMRGYRWTASEYIGDVVDRIRAGLQPGDLDPLPTQEGT